MRAADPLIQGAYMEHHAEDAQESRSADEAVRRLRTAVRMAQGVGAGLGRGSLLLRPLPPGKGKG
jgi:hypothetical protein